MLKINKIYVFLFFILNITISMWSENINNAKIFLDNGVTLFNQEKYYEAIDSFRNAIEINPYYGDAYKYLAEVYYSLGDFNISLENSLTALKYANNDADAMLILANSYRELGNYDTAEKYYKKIVDMSPSYVEVYRNLSELYLKMNKLTLALSMLNKADRINSNYWRNYISFGNYYLKNGNNIKAEEYYKKAFNLNPKERLVYVTLADFFRTTGNFQDAISLLEDGEKIFENFYSGIVILADCYLNTGNYKKAIEKYNWIGQAGVQKDKKFIAWNYYKTGLAYESMDKEKSVENYRLAIANYPNNEYFQYALEYFALNNYKIDSDIRKDLSMIRLSNSSDAYNRGETKIYFLNLKKSVTLYPYQIEARKKLFSFYETHNDFYHSYQELKSLSKIDPDSSIKDKIENYEWRLKNNKLRVDGPDFYIYKGLFLVDADFYNYSRIYADTVLYNVQYYNKFKLYTMEYRKKQGINYILEFLRENNYSFFIIASADDLLKTFKYSLFDKTGIMINQFFINFNPEDMNHSVVRFLDWMDGIFPSVWRIGNEVSQNQYFLNAGLAYGLKEKDSMTAFDLSYGSLIPLSLLKVSNVADYSCEVNIISNYMIGNLDSLKDKYAVKSDYLKQDRINLFKRVLGY